MSSIIWNNYDFNFHFLSSFSSQCQTAWTCICSCVGLTAEWSPVSDWTVRINDLRGIHTCFLTSVSFLKLMLTVQTNNVNRTWGCIWLPSLGYVFLKWSPYIQISKQEQFHQLDWHPAGRGNDKGGCGVNTLSPHPCEVPLGLSFYYYYYLKVI